MNAKRRKRLLGILFIIVLVSTALGLILFALKQNINLFYTPTQLLQSRVTPEQTVRIGGYVKKGSVHFAASGTTVHFIITDKTHDIGVDYHGVLPSLFREGQGVVITGRFGVNQLFTADEVLAKHDEKYMPWPLEKQLSK